MRNEMIGAVVRRAIEHPEFRRRLIDNPQEALEAHGFALEEPDMAEIEKIRGELRNSAVNQIMLTTESSPSMKERGKAAGVKGWIVKPFKGPAVLETFKKLVA